MRICFIFLFILSLSSLSIAQGPDTLWTKLLGGDNNDYGESVRQTIDGGFIIAGSINMDPYDDDYNFYLIKTDSQGDTIWTRNYGDNHNELAFSVRQTADSGYIMVGSKENPFDHDLIWLVKTDPAGDTAWTQFHLTTSSADFRAFDIQQVADYGYVIAGAVTTPSADIFIMKTDSLGNMVWNNSVGGGNYDEGYSLDQTSDGGYIIAGVTSSFGDYSPNVYLARFSSSGDTLWTRVYGGPYWDEAISVKTTPENGFIIAGRTYTDENGQEIYLLKTDSLGDTLWTKTYDGAGEGNLGNDVSLTSDNGYVITGGTSTPDSIFLYVLKTNNNGDSLWMKLYHGGEGNSVQQISDGGFIVVGDHIFNNDIFLLRFESESQSIPTLSEWGLLIMALLLLVAGTVAVVRRRKAVKA